MNPTDFILLFLSLAVAVVSLLAHGWNLNGVGPAFTPEGALIGPKQQAGIEGLGKTLASFLMKLKG